MRFPSLAHRCLHPTSFSVLQGASLVLVAILTNGSRWDAHEWGDQESALGGVAFPPTSTSSLPLGAGPDWQQGIAAQIASDEYQVTLHDGYFQSPNRAQNVRTVYRESGIEVMPRMGDASAWSFAWETSAFGRVEALDPVKPSKPKASGARVTYRRVDFDEWYENSPKGIEQGFTVPTRPPGESALCIKGRFAGSLRGELTEEDTVDLFDENGDHVLRYAGLYVNDANGEEVEAHLAVDGGEIAILIEDHGSTYPLTVDPLVSTPSWTGESDQNDSRFGYSVGTAGDVNGDGYSDVIVSADRYDNGETDEGKVYVFSGSTSGLSATAAWTAEGNQAGARFGYIVGTAGDVNADGYSDVIIGSVFYDNGETNEGKAFVYHGSPGGLAATPAWTAEGNQADAHFGHSGASAGDVNGDGYSDVVIGSALYDSGEADEGKAFVYHGSAIGLAANPTWTAEGNQAAANYGFATGTAGDVNGDGYSDVIVTAYAYDNGQTNEGSAFVYHGSSTGLELIPSWSAESQQAEALFGVSAGTAGDVNGDGYSDVIVGAYTYDNGQSDEGRAFIYSGSANGLLPIAIAARESNQADARYGYSVGTAGDVDGDGYSEVIIGGYAYDNGQADEGEVEIYRGGPTGIGGLLMHLESNQTGAYFGAAVATAGDVNGDGFSDVIAGAWYFDNGETDEGRAFVYQGGADLLAQFQSWTAESNQPEASFGNTKPAGDVNGDGYADVIIGIYRYDNGETDEGAAWVYYGSATGLPLNPSWTAEGNQAGAYFGGSASTAGDVNGDGYSDVLIGAPYFDNGESDEGRVFVYYGSPMGLAASPAWTAESNQSSAAFGLNSATAGDVNGDGYSDVIIAARRYDGGETNEGKAFVYHGSASGLAANPAWTAEGNQADADFGNSVATAGDVNSDGYSDVIIGAWLYDNGQMEEGKAFVYHGSITGLSASPAWTGEGNQAGANFGVSTATAGDVNGDGYSDVVVGAWNYDNGEPSEGRVFAYHGSVSGLSLIPAWDADVDQVEALFGVSVASAGDVNADGYSDVIVGGPAYDSGFTDTDEGVVGLFLGSPTGLLSLPSWMWVGDQAAPNFGIVVAGVGDVNGDGYPEAAISADRYSNGQLQEGRSFLYYGNFSPGRRILPRQQRTDGVTPIPLLGRSDSETEFRIRAAMPSVFGRTRLQVESEVKQHGVLFDGQNTVIGSYDDTGSDGVGDLDRVVSGLTPNTQYHWRVRAKYDLVRTPFQRNGPWIHVPSNGLNESDLRTAGTLPVGVAESEASPRADFDLSTARPNPFRGSCDVRLSLGHPAQVDVDVHDVLGRRVAQLLRDEKFSAGVHDLSWDGRDQSGSAASPGIYWLRVRIGNDTRVAKAVLVR